MTAIEFAIAAVQASPLGKQRAALLDCIGVTIINTVRPGVVPLYRYALNAPALEGEHHRVVAAGSSVVDEAHHAVILALRPVLQVKHTPLIRVAGRRGAGQVNGRIDLRAVQLVNDAIADIVS